MKVVIAQLTVKTLLSVRRELRKVQEQNANLSQNQLGRFDVTCKYRRVNVDLSNPKVKAKYLKMEKESEDEYCSNNERMVNGGLRQRTNRHLNFISYWKLSHMDCYKLFHNAREQITIMARDCEISAEIMFFWWFRMYKKTSHQELALLCGVGKSIAQKWWHATKDKLYVRARKTVVNDGPEDEQYWTTDKILENTMTMAKRIHDPLNEGKPILVMDGTYIYTEQIQSDHAVRQKTWSQHKGTTLVKPHLTITTNGKIVQGGACYFANGHHSDTHIYRSMTDVNYIQRCKANLNAPECALTAAQIKEYEYLHKIWTKKNGLVLTDDGYQYKNAKLRKPKETCKNKRTTTIQSHIKRRVTFLRHVTERVNASIKKWKMIGHGKVKAVEVPDLPKLVTIAIGHHNEFSCEYQKDHDDNEIQTNRLLEMQTVINNPCDKYWRKRPANRKRTDKSVPLPPKLPFDDGFETKAEGFENVKLWIQQSEWLRALNLTAEDAKDLIGRQFQHKLADRYLRWLHSNFRIKEWKTNRYVLKFENLKSKYCSSQYRHVILNFEEVVKYRQLSARRQNQQSNPNNQYGNEDEDEEMKNQDGNHNHHVNNNQMEERIAMPQIQEKKWVDIDFGLWETDLARMQYYGSCNGGAQMMNPCAHVSAAIYFIVWTLTGVLDEQLKEKKKDKRIKDSISDLGPAATFWKEQKSQNTKNKVLLFCVCNKPYHGYMIQCPGCEEHYHPTCIGMTEQEVKSRGEANFKCPSCDPYIIFFSRSCQTDRNDHGMVPQLAAMSPPPEGFPPPMIPL